MPHATPRGPRGHRNRHNIKPDPDLQSSTTTAALPNRTTPSDQGTANSNYGTSSYIPVDQSFYRNGRSDAPTPSERTTEPEPLLREVRALPNMAAESPTTNNESFFHQSFQDIGKKLKASNDTLGELQQLGVSHDVQLPELVLVGDQSAGKSSLMSGLAYLDLPRSEGTCTRCPLHIRVSRNSDWSCRVWLRKDYSYQPPQDRPISERDVTDRDPFYPWHKLPQTHVYEFKTMHDKTEIEDVLRWAQVAILSDDMQYKLFVPGSGSIATSTPIATAAEQTTAKFSPNVVALEIKGPDLPDLSFYDMPGIFQNPADVNDDYLVNVVRNLSSAYIQHPSAIILCAMPMNSDAENSCTFGLTRRLGATNRTIGVLTKADLLNDGNHAQWLAIMRGDAHHTGFGYFITSRPQGKELDELKGWERALFEDGGVDTWPTYFHNFQNRCGVEKLKAFLSERLGEEFAKSLPNIKQKVRACLKDINAKLAKLPELPANAELEIQTSLINFADTARQRVDDFTKSFNTLPSEFRNCLLHMKPKIILRDSTDIPVVELSDDDSEVGSVAGSFTSPSKRRTNTTAVTPSKRPRVGTPANGTPSGTQTGTGSFNGNGQVKPEEGRSSFPPPATPARRQLLPEPFTKYSDYGRSFRTLRQVQEEIIAKTTAGMPNRIPDKVFQDLVIAAVRPWKEPMLAFLEQTMKLLQAELSTTLNKAFEGLTKRYVYKEAQKYLKGCLDEHHKQMKQALELLYKDESSQLLTFNEAAFKQYEKEEKEIMFHFRHYIRMQAASLSTTQHVAWESLTEDKRTYELKRREAETAKLGPDRFEREVEVVAYVRGYYRLAALRFADTVSQCIICRMLPAIRLKLPYHLEEKLGVRGPDAEAVYERLIAEDEQTAQKRETYKAEKRKFEKALASIEGLETGGTTDSSSLSGANGATNGATSSSMSFSQQVSEHGSDVVMEETEQGDEA